MTPQAVSIAISAAFVFTGAGVSFLVLWRASILLSSSAPASTTVPETAVEILQGKLEALESEVLELRHRTAASPTPHSVRTSMNLDRRSQALRMHRRGESPAQISAALELPLQEVHLLLKVHHIVLQNI